MGPNNTPEQPPNKSMQEQARAAAEQIIADMRASYQSEVARINQIQDDNQRQSERALLDQRKVEEYKSKLSEQVRDAVDTGRTDSPEDKKIKAEKAKHVFLEAKALGDEGVKVGDAKSQQVVNKIVEYIKNGQISDEGALVLERNIGNDLINGIVFSKKGDPPSDFEKHLKISYQVNPTATAPLLRELGENQDVFGYEGTPQDLFDKIGMATPENDQQGQQSQKENVRDQIEAQSNADDFRLYQKRFTTEQLKLIDTFYSPDELVAYLEKMSNGDDKDNSFLTTKAVQDRKQHLREEIDDYYKKNNKQYEQGENLETQVEKHWGEEVSESFNWKISEIMNQLFMELQQKSPHKFYQDIMQEDIFTGPAMIQKKIQTALLTLHTKISQIEGDESDELNQRMKKLNLYRHAVKPHVIEERNEKDPDSLNKNIYPRVKPIPYGERIDLGKFVEHVNMTIDHIIHKTEYFHNSRAIYKHPPGEKGFYDQLGGFAEQLQGSDIEEILMLPDGQFVLEAYHLYEKMLQEDFAKMDHRHRPDQLTNQLERVNSEIEEETIAQFIALYPDLSEQRIKNIVNNAVGISRGMTMTEAEMSAYADPIDSEGKGMVASYSTNDAGSLNAFNPMHTIMRWQGEHNFNSMYFMSVNGQPGKMWDSDKAWKNMGKYMDSFCVGKGRGEGKDGLPDEVFADSMMNIGKIGGPGTRRGWRMKGALEGHFVYDKDGSVNAPDTFQAMEAIGYEAIFNFVKLKQAGPKLMMATEKTDPAQVKERRELFEYIYKKYFYDGDPQKYNVSEFDNYMVSLKEKGRSKAVDKVKEDKSLSGGPEEGGWQAKTLEEEIEFQTSNAFLENMLAHYTFAKMPTKFLRIDKNRMHKDGIGNWERIWREFRDQRQPPWEREHFDHVMKDLGTAEMLLRKQISEIIREKIKFDKDWKLNQIDKITDLPHRLTKEKIRELLSENISKNKDRKNKEFKSEKEIADVIELYEHISNNFKNNKFLDEKGYKEISSFKFTFGLEDTDLSLMAFRGTGPRMAARAIKDTATIEKEIVPWIINMPLVLNEIAINGKHDFTPIIEYMRKAQKAITDVNGVDDTYEFMYKLAGTVTNYFKKDGMAKPLFGLFKLGKLNSIAAKYAGRSTAVWEWDSRDIDRFAVTMESYGLLKNSPYNLQAPGNDGKYSGGQREDRWIINPITKKPMKWGKQRHVDYKYNSLKFRKEHGADWKAISWDYINQFLPLAIAFLLWKYIKDAMDEASGKKKQ